MSQANREMFTSILREAGVQELESDDAEAAIELNKEQALVVRNVQKFLEDDAVPQTVAKFVLGLKVMCGNEDFLKRALSPTLLKKRRNMDDSDDDTVMSLQQESLFRILLKVSQVQTEVIGIILNEITNNSADDGQDASSLRLLLSQLRYLPHIKEPAELTTKLLDILEISPFPSQLEILDSLPEILPDSAFHTAAKQLSKLLDDNNDLAGGIIDCLNALNLEPDVRMQVQDHILTRILPGTTIKQFPILLDFLMTDYKVQSLSATFLKIRNALDKIMASPDRGNKDKESGKIVIFNRLQTLATSPKVVPEALIAMLSGIKVPTDHKPVDLLLLFMLHSSAKFKKRVVELLFRKKVKNGLFKCFLLEQLFEKYMPQQLMRDFFATITEIGCSLLRSSSETAVLEFASTLFTLAFTHEFTEVIYRQELIDNLLLLTGSSDGKTVTVVLKIFLSLLEDITKIQHHTVLLMRLLEKIDGFELKDVKLVFEILCRLTCSDESLSGLKQEIHMIIRKQLSSSKRLVKHRGIIAAVVMAKHIATVSDDDPNDVSIPEVFSGKISDLTGNARDAAILLELTNTSTSSFSELVALYYDQLASMLMADVKLDNFFKAWLYENITNEFVNVYVTDVLPDKQNDIEFSMQYNLNTKDETENEISVNIAGLTLKQSEGKKHILIMAPHFRLVRLLHYKTQNGDLNTIDALLGCSVVLPTIDNFKDLDSDAVGAVADCLYHCINWFREVISGFVTQKSRKLRLKVVQRLENLIELENNLKDCLTNAPWHRLPNADGSAPIPNSSNSPQKKPQAAAAKAGGSNKKKKLKLNHDDTIPSTSAASTSKKPPATEDHRQVHFREMDTDLVILMKYSLNFDLDQISSQHISLSISQLNFILSDFVNKLRQLTTNANLGLSHLNVIEPKSLITDCVHILPNLNVHFNAIMKKIDELLEEAQGCHDAPQLYTPEALEIKLCFGLILDVLSSIFQWSGFQHSKRLDLLRDLLKSMRPSESSQLKSANHLIVDFIDRLEPMNDHCLQLSHAVSLISIMEALYNITPTPEVRKKIGKCSGKLLSQRWYNNKSSLDTGRGALVNIDVLVKSYLNGASVKTLCGLVSALQEQQSTLKSKDDCLEMLRSIDKASFPILYRNLLASLDDRVKAELQSLTNNEHLTLWKTTSLTMQGLMTIVKEQQTRSNLLCYLKKSISILKTFLSHGIPILEIMLRSKTDQVVQIFKTMQLNTRFLHHLSCFSKLTKDTSLVAYVPQFRLTLETLIYRVKAAMVANGCSEAFWMGNLKNRDLQGDDILSQSSVNSTRLTESNADDLPPDDDSSDEELLNDSDDNLMKSGSDIC